jgi:hypothetical protein
MEFLKMAISRSSQLPLSPPKKAIYYAIFAFRMDFGGGKVMGLMKGRIYTGIEHGESPKCSEGNRGIVDHLDC